MLPAARSPVFVPELFKAQVARSPHALALVQGRTRLTYAELDERVSRVARALVRSGARRGELVAILLPQSIDLVIALLGVLKAGSGYVPISNLDPSWRIKSILRDARPTVVVTNRSCRVALQEWTRFLYIDDERNDEFALSEDAEITAHDVAYVIYTSGSTGEPKGVVVEHGALTAYLTYVTTHYQGISGRILLHSPVSFDMAVTSVYGPLITGGTIDVTDLEDVAGRRDDTPWFSRPSFLKITPSHLDVLRALNPQCLPTADLVIGGEALVAASVESFRRDNPAVTVINEYGPTEATVGCCVYAVHPRQHLQPGPVPIGQPTLGTTLLVLDTGLAVVPKGQIGELYIAGDQLARGYLGRSAATAAAFLANPFGPPGSRMYRSGDLVRQRADGLLEYAGRVDDQLKIGGVRVDPAEVSAAIVRAEGVSHAVVTALPAASGKRGLVAYVTAEPGTNVDTAWLRAHVAALLPGAMVPAVFVVLGKMPLTANGKVDYRALPELAGTESGLPFLPRTPAEELLCGLFSELTGVSPVGIDDDFFALGGTSLAAARLVSRARRKGVFLGLQEVLSRRTVRALVHGVGY